MSWLVDPVTREPLPALETSDGPAGHPATGWVFEREDGIPVRMRWWECHCPKHQAEIDALNERIRGRLPA